MRNGDTLPIGERRVPRLAKRVSLIKQVRETIKRYNLLDRGDRVVVGVSGGPDSVALILLLKSLEKELGLSLRVAHLDHQLRKNSHRDREFVKSLARRLHLPFISAKVDIGNKKGSIEERGREARLRFLSSVAKISRAGKIALGHNQDDQAETVLMRMLRGTGLSGLAAILPKRKINNRVIIRPLIETSRKTIESYLRRRKIRPRIDSSNKNMIYLRNRIRNRLIPELVKDYNPNIKGVLTNLAQTAAGDYDYLEKQAIKMFKRLSGPLPRQRRRHAIRVRFKLNAVSKLHCAIQRMVLRLAIAKIQGTTRRLNFKHIKELEELILSRPVNSVVDLPHNISVLKDKKYLCIYKRKLKRL